MSEFNVPGYQIGDTVRVRVCGTTRGARRAIISDVSDTGEYSVVYEHGWKGLDEEEDGIEAGRISALQDFEINFSPSSSTPSYAEEELKSNGSVLYKLGDYPCAAQWYHRAMPCRKATITVGQKVMVYSDALDDTDAGAGLIGMVSLLRDVDDGADGRYTVDVETETGGEQELLLCENDFVLLPAEPARCALMRALYLNLARCSFSTGRYGWACRHAGVAYLLAGRVVEFGDSAARHKAMADALVIRCKALIRAGRAALAVGDADLLQMIEPGDRCAAVTKEIEVFRKNRKKSNRKLAKDVAAWVATSLEVAEKEHGLSIAV